MYESPDVFEDESLHMILIQRQGLIFPIPLQLPFGAIAES
jgi:hypothetical protein